MPERFNPWTSREPLLDPPVEAGDGAHQLWLLTTTTFDAHLHQSAAAVRETYPRAEIGFLAQSDMTGYLSEHYPGAPVLHSARNGYFGMAVSPPLVRRLRRRKPSRFLILYRNDDGAKHKRVEMLAFFSGAAQVYGYDVQGRWWRVPRRYLTFGLIRPILQSLPAKLVRALFCNLTFAAFLLGQAAFLRLLGPARPEGRRPEAQR